MDSDPLKKYLKIFLILSYVSLIVWRVNYLTLRLRMSVCLEKTQCVGHSSSIYVLNFSTEVVW